MRTAATVDNVHVRPVSGSAACTTMSAHCPSRTSTRTPSQFSQIPIDDPEPKPFRINASNNYSRRKHTLYMSHPNEESFQQSRIPARAAGIVSGVRAPRERRVHATSLPPGQERTEVEAWLAFADAHLQNLTESVSAPKLPTPPKPSGDDLKPFLGHWSPYGPRSY
ncbi:hypothetical protein ACFVYR_36155 [Streptomyces sp. NPDC058284]|uniref:hypothetical protein n=1 Tax=unclassified Streptomyces TaxID=2593676 RepID=UPI00364E67A9